MGEERWSSLRVAFDEPKTACSGVPDCWLAYDPPAASCSDPLADADAGAHVVPGIGSVHDHAAERFCSIGLLDEGYFMYWKDADWCHRAHARGYGVLYDPTLMVTHRRGSSSRYRPVATTISFHRALRYWRTNVAPSRASTAAAATALAVRSALKVAAIATRSIATRARAKGDEL